MRKQTCTTAVVITREDTRIVVSETNITNQKCNLLKFFVVQIKPCPKPPHRPKLGDHRWYSLKALLDWADNLGRWEGLGH